MHLRELGEVARHAIVERQPAAITQLHHRDRGERLGDGGPMEDGALVHALTQGPVGEAVLVVRQHPAVPQHEHAAADHAVPDGERIERADERGPARGRRGGRGWRGAVRELPDIDPPIISVSTELPGANAQVVETAVTDILEEELSTIQGLRTLTSSSQEEFSNITLEFNLDRPVDVAAQDVRDKVSRVRGRLPQDVREPVIAKQEADAQPFFWLALSSAHYDLMQLSDVADRLVKARLQSLAGVGSAGIYGERRFAMRVWVRPDALSKGTPWTPS